MPRMQHIARLDDQLESELTVAAKLRGSAFMYHTNAPSYYLYYGFLCTLCILQSSESLRVSVPIDISR